MTEVGLSPGLSPPASSRCPPASTSQTRRWWAAAATPSTSLTTLTRTTELIIFWYHIHLNRESGAEFYCDNEITDWATGLPIKIATNNRCHLFCDKGGRSIPTDSRITPCRCWSPSPSARKVCGLGVLTSASGATAPGPDWQAGEERGSRYSWPTRRGRASSRPNSSIPFRALSFIV